MPTFLVVVLYTLIIMALMEKIMVVGVVIIPLEVLEVENKVEVLQTTQVIMVATLV